MPTFHYIVDDEKLTTDRHEMTPTTILNEAGVDPQQHYLEQIDGANTISFKDDPDKIIHMHENMRFVSVYTGPTHLS